MKNKEIRKFEIDRNKYTKCRLASVKIKKEEQSETEMKFFAVETAADAYITCKSGEVTALETARNRMKQLKKCGIGTMLIQLCFNEISIHNVVNNDKNAAVASLENVSKANKIKIAQKIEEWVKYHCKRAVRMKLTCDPASDARVFFSSAIASGYTEMFFKLKKEFYPREGRGLVEDLMKRYTDEGNYLESDGTNNNVRVLGEHWFFCKPRTSNLPS